MKNMTYDQEEDILSIELADKKYWKSVEISGGIVIDISDDGSVISIEISRASSIFKKDARKVLEHAQAISTSA